MRQRAKVLPLASGTVLEVGIGSGLNLAYYEAEKVTKIWGLDPSAEMRERAERAVRSLPLEVEMIGLPSDEIPLDDHSVDTVVFTYTLCTIPETAPALEHHDSFHSTGCSFGSERAFRNSKGKSDVHWCQAAIKKLS